MPNLKLFNKSTLELIADEPTKFVEMNDYYIDFKKRTLVSRPFYNSWGIFINGRMVNALMQLPYYAVESYDLHVLLDSLASFEDLKAIALVSRRNYLSHVESIFEKKRVKLDLYFFEDLFNKTENLRFSPKEIVFRPNKELIVFLDSQIKRIKLD